MHASGSCEFSDAPDDRRPQSPPTKAQSGSHDQHIWYRSFQAPGRPGARMHPLRALVVLLGLRSSQDDARPHPPEHRAIPYPGFAMHGPLRPGREQRSITTPGNGEDACGLARLQPPLDDPAPLDIPQPLITLPNSPSFPPPVHDLPCSDQCRSLHRPWHTSRRSRLLCARR